MNIDKFLETLSPVEYNELKRAIGRKDKTEGVILTPILDWAEEKEMSVRLRNCLISAQKYPNGDLVYLETVTHEDLLKCKNFGDAALREFIKLRGF